MKLRFFIIGCLLPLWSLAQADSLYYLSQQEFLSQVEEHHPAAQQARLLLDIGDAARLEAGGSFDPKLFSEVSQKYFDEKTYYRLQNSGLQIPAWFGLSAKLGYEQNDGEYLNPQNQLPASGLFYGDLSLTLLQGLLMDERRASLKRARLLQDASRQELRLALNELLQEAAEAYWQWYESEQLLTIYDEAVELARIRMAGVKRSARVGEIPLIDTLEASIQWQNRRQSLRKAREANLKARQGVSSFLWLDGSVPLELQPRSRPLYLPPETNLSLNESWREEHPLLELYRNKIDQLEVTESWRRQQLLPQLDLNYKFLAQPVGGEEQLRYTPNNYSWGLQASFPIFLRKERGKLQQMNLKIRDAELEVQNKQWQLQTKLQGLQGAIIIALQRLEEQRQISDNYRALLRAELTRFASGESSLFLVNQRELRFLEAREKTVELEASIQRQIMAYKALAALLA